MVKLTENREYFPIPSLEYLPGTARFLLTCVTVKFMENKEYIPIPAWNVCQALLLPCVTVKPKTGAKAAPGASDIPWGAESWNWLLGRFPSLGGQSWGCDTQGC